MAQPVCRFTLANAAAKEYVRGPGSFVPAFVDELYAIRTAAANGDDRIPDKTARSLSERWAAKKQPEIVPMAQPVCRFTSSRHSSMNFTPSVQRRQTVTIAGSPAGPRCTR
jgi:hypothetical protein